LTIVLPVHNAESRLRANVREVLELACELTSKFGVLIIDDGSTDATFEVAEELATHYPQVSVRRHPCFRGISETLQYVQRRVRSDVVMVHDGVAPINQQQIRKLWRQWLGASASHATSATTSRETRHDVSDLADVRSLHNAIKRAHNQLAGFHLLSLPEHGAMFLDPLPVSDKAPRDATRTAHVAHSERLGRIPRLPRPKFLVSLANFALGE
jgi:glycosyltransferase involved in cell wall biosynthesis